MNILKKFLLLSIVVILVSIIDEAKADTTGLKAYYNFEETSGSLLVNSLSQISDADSTTEQSINKNVGGIIGNGWKFDDSVSSTRIKIGGTISDWDFMNTGDTTLNVWIKGSDPENIAWLFGTQDGNFMTGYRLMWDSGGSNERMQLRIHDGANDDVFEFIDGYIETSDNQWHMYTIVHDNGNEVFWYKDGSFFDNDLTDGAADGSASLTPMIGNKQSAPFLNPLNGVSIDELSIWSRILSPTEIEELYNSGNGRLIEGDNNNQLLVGGHLISINMISLSLYSIQLTSSWFLPIIVSSVGIGLSFLKKHH